jgi:hypothetical protein
VDKGCWGDRRVEPVVIPAIVEDGARRAAKLIPEAQQGAVAAAET